MIKTAFLLIQVSGKQFLVYQFIISNKYLFFFLHKYKNYYIIFKLICPEFPTELNCNTNIGFLIDVH